MMEPITEWVRTTTSSPPTSGAGTGDATADTVFELQVPAGKVQPIEEGAHLIDIGSRVDEGAEGHVAGDAGETVEPRHR